MRRSGSSRRCLSGRWLCLGQGSSDHAASGLASATVLDGQAGSALAAARDGAQPPPPSASHLPRGDPQRAGQRSTPLGIPLDAPRDVRRLPSEPPATRDNAPSPSFAPSAPLPWEQRYTDRPRGESAFFPDSNSSPDKTLDAPAQAAAYVTEPSNAPRVSQAADLARSASRLRVRHSFDVFADQLPLLREIALTREARVGQRVRLGDLVQEALDRFIADETDERT